MPKDVEGYRPLKALIGAESIIAKEGSDWKATRKRFNPNFQPKHIHSLTEQIATRVKVFTSRLQQLADGGDPLKLSDYAQHLVHQLILLLRSLQARRAPARLLEFFLTIIAAYSVHPFLLLGVPRNRSTSSQITMLDKKKVFL